MRPEQRFYEEAQRHPDLIWRVCDYAGYIWGNKNCKRCPRLSHDKDHGPMMPGCIMASEELVAIILEELEVSKPLVLT